MAFPGCERHAGIKPDIAFARHGRGCSANRGSLVILNDERLFPIDDMAAERVFTQDLFGGKTRAGLVPLPVGIDQRDDADLDRKMSLISPTTRSSPSSRGVSRRSEGFQRCQAVAFPLDHICG